MARTTAKHKPPSVWSSFPSFPSRIQAVWGPRRETLRGTVRRWSAFLAALHSVPGFSPWTFDCHGKIRARAEDRKGIQAAIKSASSIHSRTSRFVQSDVTIYSAGMFALVCCGHVQKDDGNGISINAPYADPRRFHRLGAVLKLVRAVIAVWKPDHLVVDTPYQPTFPIGPRSGGPEVGWINYFRTRRLMPDDVPSAYKVLPSGRTGSIVVVTKEPGSVREANVRDQIGQVRLELGFSVITDPTKARNRP